MGLHVREGVKEHNMHIKPKSYKCKLLGKLVVQQPILPKCAIVDHKVEMYTMFHIKLKRSL